MHAAPLQRRGLGFRLTPCGAAMGRHTRDIPRLFPRIPPEPLFYGFLIPPRSEKPCLFYQVRALFCWSRGPDSNRRPSGYEPTLSRDVSSFPSVNSKFQEPLGF